MRTEAPPSDSRLTVLAIETSCDETSVAVVREPREVLVSLVSSQVAIHREYGGVVPELAARRHLEQINPVLEEALERSGVGPAAIDAVAVTAGPGLVVALLIGMATAKALAFAWDVPLVGVNHLEGHIYANFLVSPDLEPPLLALIVSGGHTSLVLMEDHGSYRTLGETLDDAAGEAFDKIAAFLDLDYPGGPVIDRLAVEGDPERYSLPRALLRSPDYNFSLSGVKTAVVNLVTRERSAGRAISLADLAASFQAAVFDVQVDKALRAVREYGLERLVLAGGVAANSYLRRSFAMHAERAGIRLYQPPPELCTDNAAMIGMAGLRRLRDGRRLDLNAEVHSTLSLEESDLG